MLYCQLNEFSDINEIWDDPVSIVIRVRIRRPFLSPQRPDRLWNPPSLLSSGCRRFFLRE